MENREIGLEIKLALAAPNAAFQSQWQGTADSVIALGKTFMGTPYVFGAKRFQTRNYDCSDEAYPNEVGINKVRHVGIYLGNGKILHTYEAGIGVVISTLHNDPREGEYWYQNFLFAKRVIVN
jgi:cell wall-associated NlpC family hydrolase